MAFSSGPQTDRSRLTERWCMIHFILATSMGINGVAGLVKIGTHMNEGSYR